MNPNEPLRLTKLAKRAGCAAKHPPGFLLPLLGMLPPVTDERVIVGSSTADDAAIYKLNDDLALVFTTDFFTPIVDAPRDFGRVAATNAISDVYAMGGKPTTALSIVGFPDSLPATVLGEILAGACEIAAEAGIAITGGHTIKSEEPIFGLAVVGTVHPKRVLSNAGAKPGDVLILTKPLGLGIITTAAKNDQDTKGAITDAIRVMTTLNGAAADVLRRYENIHALTDITGFGLLGHLRNITAGSGVTAEVWADRVPVLPAAREYVKAGIAPGGTRANAKFLADWVTFEGVSQEEQLLLCDAQTSGGLLACVPEDVAEEVAQAMAKAGTLAHAIVGRITGTGSGKIRVTPTPLAAAR